ncbi:MAG: fused MFS/spermidine synthase [Endomicrobiaceae bacterium]|nr:fused MFS/spermidine synthase [Endomicrobiaceae bacterium]
MNKQLKSLFFLMFFLSGLSGLVYQIVWIRLAFANFGFILPIMSVTISVFMLGLAVGSWLGGKYIEQLSQKFKISPIIFYAGTEFFIATGALAVPKLFNIAQKILLATGQSDSLAYLSLSAVSLVIAMLLWCIAMGFTFPFVVAYLKKVEIIKGKSFSFLYTANVIGALCGILLTTVMWIETFGFAHTLLIAGLSNISAGLLAILAFKKFNVSDKDVVCDIKKEAGITPAGKSKIVFIILFVTGFSCLGMEVAWTRAFSPVLGTMVYAYSFLLAGYMAATWLGAFLYRRDLAKNKVKSVGFLMAALTIFVFLPILINDPKIFKYNMNLLVQMYSIYGYLFQIILTIFPLCATLGYLTPSIIDEYSGGNEKLVGKSYSINIIGCILGPIIVSYFLLPMFGAKTTLIVLSVPYTILFFVFIKQFKPINKIVISALSIAVVFIAVGYSTTYEVPFQPDSNWTREVKRDSMATVVGMRNNVDKFESRLLVNGMGITTLTSITKFMAHLPLAFCKNEPKDALVICFGMGTTYRSLLSWDINVTAVELTPSVVKMFGLYHEDAQEVLKNPKGEIIIDDGRRYLMRTNKKFDVITLDPPPPIEASSSGLLYSREFYRVAKLRLKENGILQQWLPADIYNDTTVPVLKAIVSEFKYVKVYILQQGYGIFFIASDSPIDNLIPSQIANKMPVKAREDLLEWIKLSPGYDGLKESSNFVGILTELSIEKILKTTNDNSVITDDSPYNEYFLLRRLL